MDEITRELKNRQTIASLGQYDPPDDRCALCGLLLEDPFHDEEHVKDDVPVLDWDVARKEWEELNRENKDI